MQPRSIDARRCTACDYDLSATQPHPVTDPPTCRCPECGLTQLASPPPKPDRTLGAIAIASWVPWAWALVATCIFSLLKFFSIPVGAFGLVLFWLAFATFAALFLGLLAWALRIAWIDVPRGQGLINCACSLPILLVGHVCAIITAAVTFTILMLTFAVIASLFR